MGKDFFFISLESSETYADPRLNEIGAKLNFSSIKVPEIENGHFLKRKNVKKTENCLCICVRTLRIFSDQ